MAAKDPRTADREAELARQAEVRDALVANELEQLKLAQDRLDGKAPMPHEADAILAAENAKVLNAAVLAAAKEGKK